MMRRHAMLAALLMGVTFSARAGDWPMWAGTPQRNMVNTTEKNIAKEWDVESGKNVKWKAALGSQTYGNPTVAKGKVYVGTNNGGKRNPAFSADAGVVMCFRESDGEFLWQAVHEKLASGRVNDWPEQGICSTACVDGDKVYYVSNRCQLVCADPEGFADGKNNGPYVEEKFAGPHDADIIWMVDMMATLGVFPHNMSASSPTIVGDKIFLITSNGVDEGHLFIPAPQAPSFICVDKNNGKVLWTSNLPGKGILHGQWSSPSYGVVNGKAQVYFPGGDGWLYALDAETGEMVWKFDCNPKDAKYVLGGRGTRNEIIGTPVFSENKVYVGVGQDPEHGEGPGHFYAVDATKTGDVTESGQIWHFKDINRSLSTAAVKDGLVYICDLSGFLYCIDEKSGSLVWKDDVLAAVWSSPTIIDGALYLGDEDGDVKLWAPGREKKQLGEFSVGNAAYTTPVAANGTLFVSCRNILYAFAPGAKFEGEAK